MSLKFRDIFTQIEGKEDYPDVEFWYDEDYGITLAIIPPSRRTICFDNVTKRYWASRPRAKDIKRLNISLPWQVWVSIPMVSVGGRIGLVNTPNFFFASRHPAKTTLMENFELFGPYLPNMETSRDFIGKKIYQYVCLGDTNYDRFSRCMERNIHLDKLPDLSKDFLLKLIDLFYSGVFNDDIIVSTPSRKKYGKKNLYLRWFDPRWTPAGVSRRDFLKRNTSSSVSLSTFYKQHTKDATCFKQEITV